MRPENKVEFPRSGVIMSLPTWELRTELGSSVWKVSILSYWSISPALKQKKMMPPSLCVCTLIYLCAHHLFHGFHRCWLPEMQRITLVPRKKYQSSRPVPPKTLFCIHEFFMMKLNQCPFICWYCCSHRKILKGCFESMIIFKPILNLLPGCSLLQALSHFSVCRN